MDSQFPLTSSIYHQETSINRCLESSISSPSIQTGHRTDQGLLVGAAEDPFAIHPQPKVALAQSVAQGPDVVLKSYAAAGSGWKQPKRKGSLNGLNQQKW